MIIKTQRTTYEVPEDVMKISTKFVTQAKKEFGELLKAVVLFGSSVQNPAKMNKDIDLMIILDDTMIDFTKEVVTTYRLIVEKICSNIGGNLHVQTIKLTTYWEYMKAGDPVAINILRYGIPLLDHGFVTAMQRLLAQGRIRPSTESIYNYLWMSFSSFERAKEKHFDVFTDYYWAVVDSTHALLMKINIIPPAPEYLSQFAKKNLVPKYMSKKDADFIDKIYREFKAIVHRETKFMDEKKLEETRKEVEKYLNNIKKAIEEVK